MRARVRGAAPLVLALATVWGAAAAAAPRGVPLVRGLWFGDEVLCGEPGGGPGLGLVGGSDIVPVPITVDCALDTAGSFSVAAAVRLDRLDDARAVAVAQGGERSTAYALGLVGGNFSFSATPSAEAPPREEGHCWAAAPPQPEAWTHLVGLFDRAAGQLRIFVDGHLAGTLPWQKSWTAPGPTCVGGFSVEGSLLDVWPGEVEDVRLFATALTPANVLAIYEEWAGAGS